MILPDILEENLDVVFCGTAAGKKSAERGAYYAGAGNQFYATLNKCGFTPHTLKPDDFRELLRYNLGLTDLVKHHFGMDKDLKKEYFDTKSFREKILNYRPKFVCFNGKEAAKVFFGLASTKEINYGLQNSTILNTKLYVAPSTSVRAIAYWDERIWAELKICVDKS